MGLYDALNMLTDLQSLIETELDKKSGGDQIKKNTEDDEDDEGKICWISYRLKGPETD